MRAALAVASVASILLGLLVGAGCGSKKSGAKKAPVPPPTIELWALPASAEVVIGADLGKLADSRLVALAVAQMYRRDPGLEKRINALRSDCGLEPGRDIQRLVIGMGPAPEQVVLVAAGSFEQNSLAGCLNKLVASGGGSVTGSQVDGHVFYNLDTGARAVWLTVGAGGVLAVSPSKAFLRETLGSDEKAWHSPALKPHLARVDRSASLWGAGLVPSTIGAGLTKVTSGAVKKPPIAVYGSLELGSGLSAQLNVVMSSAEDAKTVESKAIIELALGATVAQRYGLGRLLSKLKAESNAETLMLSASLTVQDLNQLLSAAPESAPAVKGLDTKGPSLQDSADQNPEN